MPLLMPTVRILLAAILLFLSLGTGPSFAADTLDSLRRKQASLEQELERVKNRIAEMEAKGSAPRAAGTRKTWFVKEFGIEDVDAGGGVEPYVVFLNPDPGSYIKYIRVRATLHNADGAVVASRNSGETTTLLSYTGPLGHSDGEVRAGWGPVWYNAAGRCMKVESIEVTFVSGKVQSFAGKDLRAALAPEVVNECRPRRR